MHLVVITLVLFFFVLQVDEVGLPGVSFVARYKFLLGAVVRIVPFFSTVETSGGASVSWGGNISSGRRSSSLPPVAISSPSPVIGCTSSAEVHGHQNVIHRWGCIGGVIVLGVLLLLVVSLPIGV